MKYCCETIPEIKSLICNCNDVTLIYRLLTSETVTGEAFSVLLTSVCNDKITDAIIHFGADKTAAETFINMIFRYKITPLTVNDILSDMRLSKI